MALAKLQSLSVEFAGLSVIDATTLYESHLCPDLFRGKTKQARKAVGDAMRVGEDFLIARKRPRADGYVAYEGNPTAPQARYLVKLDSLLAKQTLTEPGAKAKVPAAIRAIWGARGLLGGDKTNADGADATGPAPPPVEEEEEEGGRCLEPQPEVELQEHELFKDAAGTTCHVAFRGTREHADIYADAADVGRMLDMADVGRVLRRDAYLASVDYVYIPVGAQPKLHLTYTGLMRLLHRSNKPMARAFCDWASQVVYATHLGTQDQRSQLAADLMGYPVDAVRKFMSSCYAHNIAGVYLWALGTVGQLREHLRFDKGHHLDDKYVVAKVGNSKDVKERSGNLKCEFKKMGITMELYMFAPVDPERVFAAERGVKEWFKERREALKIGRKFEGFTELVAFAPGTKEKAAIKSQFKVISMEFGGATNNQIQKMQLKLDMAQVECKAAEAMLLTERKMADTLTENAKLWRQLYEEGVARGTDIVHC